MRVTWTAWAAWAADGREVALRVDEHCRVIAAITDKDDHVRVEVALRNSLLRLDTLSREELDVLSLEELASRAEGVVERVRLQHRRKGLGARVLDRLLGRS